MVNKMDSIAKEMLKVNHTDMVNKLAKPGADILASLSEVDCHMLHMTLGIAGEVGELVDAIKKSIKSFDPQSAVTLFTGKL